jgi:hypothetical protein
MSEEPDARMCECGNCQWTGRVDQLGCQMWDIPDFFARVAEGEICPVGECPECEALARLIEIPEHTIAWVLEYVRERDKGAA